MKIILASQSPRRQELLKQIVRRFDVKPSHFKESLVKEKNPVRFVRKVAEAKAESVAKKTKGTALIIAADTIVVFPARGGSALGRKNKIIGKPKNDQDAFKILSRLAGQRQWVITAFCLINTKTNKKIIALEKTMVKMRRMSPREIKDYVATGEGRDKAGAYAIQGRADPFIAYFKGDYYNVVGLPIHPVRKAILRLCPKLKNKFYNYHRLQ